MVVEHGGFGVVSHARAAHFVMVTTAEEDRLRQARELVSEMEADGLKLSGIVINRFLDERTWQDTAHAAAGRSGLEHLKEIPILADELARDAARRPPLAALMEFLEAYRDRTLAEIERVAAFARELPAGVKLAIAPEIDAGVPDLGVLARVAEYVVGGSAVLRILEGAAARIRSRDPGLTARQAAPQR